MHPQVDLFSLGVVAFELWHPFSTAMERAVLLRDLRERGAMPAEFEGAQPVVARLIRWLLAPNPADRPTAREVLRCELLPPTVGDEQLTDLLRRRVPRRAGVDGWGWGWVGRRVPGRRVPGRRVTRRQAEGVALGVGATVAVLGGRHVWCSARPCWRALMARVWAPAPQLCRPLRAWAAAPSSIPAWPWPLPLTLPCPSAPPRPPHWLQPPRQPARVRPSGGRPVWHHEPCRRRCSGAG